MLTRKRRLILQRINRINNMDNDELMREFRKIGQKNMTPNEVRLLSKKVRVFN